MTIPLRVEGGALPGVRGKALILLAKPVSSTPKQNGLRGSSDFPAQAFQFWRFFLCLRVAEAEIADENPGCRDIQDGGDFRGVEDRYPAHAEFCGAGCEPECVHGHYRGVGGGFRHGGPAQAVSLAGFGLGEDCEVAGGFVQAGEFQIFVAGGFLGVLAGEGLGVAGLEIRSHGGAAGGVVDRYEAPGLA